jgi:hypothetical protein
VGASRGKNGPAWEPQGKKIPVCPLYMSYNIEIKKQTTAESNWNYTILVISEVLNLCTSLKNRTK